MVTPGEFLVGDQVFSIDSAGKRRAILRITKIKGERAIAELVRGKPAVGHAIQIRGAGPGSPPASHSSGDSPPEMAYSSSKPPFGFMKRGRSALGFGLAQASNSLSIQASSAAVTETINLKSSSIGLYSFVDLHQSKSMTWRLGVGYQSFGGTGTTQTPLFCSGSPSCELNISYLTAEGWLQFNLFQTRSRTRIWAGAGGEFMLAVGKKNNINALQVDSWSTFLFGSLGADVGLSPGGALNFSFDYGIQPIANAQAKAGLQMLRLGYTLLY